MTGSEQLQQATSSEMIRREYEFDARQDEVIDGLGSSMRIVAIVTMVMGLLTLIYGAWRTLRVYDAFGTSHLRVFIDPIATTLNGVIGLAIGSWLKDASSSFRGIVSTKGTDVQHLMTALARLRKVYSLLATLIILALGLCVLVIATTIASH